MNIIDDLKQHFTPIVEQLGYELVDIELIHKSKEKFLTFYIYSREGITVDDCEKVSKYVDPILDQLDLIKGFYYLEVSSPDLNKPLKTKRDFERNKDQLLEIKLKNGEIITAGYVDYTKDYLVVEIGEDKKEIQFSDIKYVKVAIVF